MSSTVFLPTYVILRPELSAERLGGLNKEPISNAVILSEYEGSLLSFTPVRVKRRTLRSRRISIGAPWLARIER